MPDGLLWVGGFAGFDEGREDRGADEGDGVDVAGGSDFGGEDARGCAAPGVELCDVVLGGVFVFWER